MEIALTLGLVGVGLALGARTLRVLLHRVSASIEVTPSLDQLDRPTDPLAIAAVRMDPAQHGAPVPLIELAEQLVSRSFSEVRLQREALLDQPVGWVLWVASVDAPDDAVTIVATHDTPELICARAYQHHQPMHWDRFAAWVNQHAESPISTAITETFTHALRNDWSASIRRRKDGRIDWFDLRARATPFAEPHAEEVVIDMLHNAHTGIEDLSSFRNGEPIENLTALTTLNERAPKSLPTSTLKG